MTIGSYRNANGARCAEDGCGGMPPALLFIVIPRGTSLKNNNHFLGRNGPSIFGWKKRERGVTLRAAAVARGGGGGSTSSCSATFGTSKHASALEVSNSPERFRIPRYGSAEGGF